MTTRRRNLWVFNGLGRRLGALTAFALGLGVPDFGLGVLAMFGLPPGRLPLTDLAQTFRLLAVPLVPAPRLVGASAAFAHTEPRARSAPSGRAVGLSLNVEGAHGRIELPREKLGEDVSAFSPGAFTSRTRQAPISRKSWKETRQRRKQIQRRALEEDTSIEAPSHGALRMIRNSADFPTGPSRHQSRLAKWELSSGNPYPRDLLALSQAFGVSLKYLCDDDEKDPHATDNGQVPAPALTEDEQQHLRVARRIGMDRAMARMLKMDEPD